MGWRERERQEHQAQWLVLYNVILSWCKKKWKGGVSHEQQKAYALSIYIFYDALVIFQHCPGQVCQQAWRAVHHCGPVSRPCAGPTVSERWLAADIQDHRGRIQAGACAHNAGGGRPWRYRSVPGPCAYWCGSIPASVWSWQEEAAAKVWEQGERSLLQAGLQMCLCFVFSSSLEINRSLTPCFL